MALEILLIHAQGQYLQAFKANKNFDLKEKFINKIIVKDANNFSFCKKNNERKMAIFLNINLLNFFSNYLNKKHLRTSCNKFIK